MNETMFAALVLIFVGAAGFCLGHILASSPLRKVVERQEKSELATARFFARLTVDFCALKDRVDALDGKGAPKEEPR